MNWYPHLIGGPCDGQGAWRSDNFRQYVVVPHMDELHIEFNLLYPEERSYTEEVYQIHRCVLDGHMIEFYAHTGLHGEDATHKLFSKMVKETCQAK